MWDNCGLVGHILVWKLSDLGCITTSPINPWRKYSRLEVKSLHILSQLPAICLFPLDWEVFLTVNCCVSAH